LPFLHKGRSEDILKKNNDYIAMNFEKEFFRLEPFKEFFYSLYFLDTYFSYFSRYQWFEEEDDEGCY